MSDFTKRLRQIESENSECSILAGNCADAIEIEQKKVAIEIARLRAKNEKLRAALRDCASDLESEIRGRYTGGGGWDIHQALVKKFDMDMATVRAAAAALKETENEA